ncbi:MAG TPA: hypothetical protein DCL60_13600 [Armatimonadetes bacterium]|nr:hypothetical protein [Armatimonadota bacterium]
MIDNIKSLALTAKDYRQMVFASFACLRETAYLFLIRRLPLCNLGLGRGDTKSKSCGKRL